MLTVDDKLSILTNEILRNLPTIWRFTNYLKRHPVVRGGRRLVVNSAPDIFFLTFTFTENATLFIFHFIIYFKFITFITFVMKFESSCYLKLFVNSNFSSCGWRKLLPENYARLGCHTWKKHKKAKLKIQVIKIAQNIFILPHYAFAQNSINSM